jgi:type I restriction enzyme, S subunit
MINSGWKKVKLGEVCTIRRGASPRPIQNYLSGSGMPWVKIADATATTSKYITKTKEFIKSEGISKSVKIYPNTLILSNSATPGLPKFVRIEACVHDGWLILSEFKEILPDFLYYQLLKVRKYLVNNVTGTIFQNLKTDVVKKFKISLPPVIEQKAIANILSCFDDKIELNNKINSILEQISQAIFKHWFIDFGFPNEQGKPYKSSGGEFIDSELGKIPKGWEIGFLNDFNIEVCSGKWGSGKYTSKDNLEVSCIRGTDLAEINVGRLINLPKRFINNLSSEEYLLRDGDIIIEISGGSPTQSTGRALLISKDILNFYNNKLVCSNFCKIIRSSNIFKSYYLYNFLKLLYNKGIFFNFEIGTTGIKNLDFKFLFSKFKVVIPDKKIIEFYYHKTNKLILKIYNNAIQNNKLAQIRDILLPKLITGKIRLNLEDTKEG